jgi:hypothetical protein
MSRRTKTAAERSRERYRRAAAVIAPITLDAARARRLAHVLRHTGETRADCVRRLIDEEHDRIAERRDE